MVWIVFSSLVFGAFCMGPVLVFEIAVSVKYARESWTSWWPYSFFVGMALALSHHLICWWNRTKETSRSDHFRT